MGLNIAKSVFEVAVALRQSLIELSNLRSVQQGQETKMEQVYQYLTGMKFRQRVEAVIEKFNDMREDLDRERRFMGKQWSKREAQILAVVDLVGMVGDLQEPFARHPAVAVRPQ